MNTEDKKIDKLFNKALANQQFPIPDSYLIDLDKRLAKRKKRLFFIWFSSFGAITVLLVCTFLYFNLNTRSNESHALKTAVTKEIDNSLNKKKKHENEIQKPSKEKTQNEVILNSNKKQIKSYLSRLLI